MRLKFPILASPAPHVQVLLSTIAPNQIPNILKTCSKKSKNKSVALAAEEHEPAASIGGRSLLQRRWVIPKISLRPSWDGIMYPFDVKMLRSIGKYS